MNEPIKHRIRCAVYTRTASINETERGINSPNAQRGAGEAYIASQGHEGWGLVPDIYDDGGFSGGNMNRPGLKRLLVDIGADKIDVVVVHSIDRLTRSLLDLVQMIGVFDKHNVRFVSVKAHYERSH